MDKFCCFNCPKGDYNLKELDDKCPVCGFEYGFPLTTHSPQLIGDYTVVKPLNRGFYGATFIVEKKDFNQNKKAGIKSCSC